MIIIKTNKLVMVIVYLYRAQNLITNTLVIPLSLL
jgi:hypothetical protein